MRCSIDAPVGIRLLRRDGMLYTDGAIIRDLNLAPAVRAIRGRGHLSPRAAGKKSSALYIARAVMRHTGAEMSLCPIRNSCQTATLCPNRNGVTNPQQCPFCNTGPKRERIKCQPEPMQNRNPFRNQAPNRKLDLFSIGVLRTARRDHIFNVSGRNDASREP